MIDYIDGWRFNESVLDRPHLAPDLIDVLPRATGCVVSRVRGFGCRPYFGGGWYDNVFACDHIAGFGEPRDATAPLMRLAKSWSNADIEELVLYVLRARRWRPGRSSVNDIGWWSNVRCAAASAAAGSWAYASCVPYALASGIRVREHILEAAERHTNRAAMNAELTAAIAPLFR
jgi:hypothetical protein